MIGEDNNLISVIIPTHNRANVLPRAIKSVQNQTMAVDEIIVVSDGSTDNTADVVDKLRARDSRIKFIEYHPGVNGNHARNIGIENANGDYICFLDDDDEWYDYKIEKQMQVFAANPEVGLVYCGLNMIFNDLKYDYYTKPSRSGDLSKRIMIYNDITNPGATIIKADVLKKAGTFDENMPAMQDYDLWIRITRITQVDFVKEPCVHIYNSINSDQITSNTQKYIDAKYAILEKYKHYIEEYDEEYQKEIHLAARLAIARRCMRNGEGKLARKYIKESFGIKIKKSGLALYVASFLPYVFVLKIRGRFRY